MPFNSVKHGSDGIGFLLVLLHTSRNLIHTQRLYQLCTSINRCICNLLHGSYTDHSKHREFVADRVNCGCNAVKSESTTGILKFQKPILCRAEVQLFFESVEDRHRLADTGLELSVVELHLYNSLINGTHAVVTSSQIALDSLSITGWIAGLM